MARSRVRKVNQVLMAGVKPPKIAVTRLQEMDNPAARASQETTSVGYTTTYEDI